MLGPSFSQRFSAPCRRISARKRRYVDTGPKTLQNALMAGVEMDDTSVEFKWSRTHIKLFAVVIWLVQNKMQIVVCCSGDNTGPSAAHGPTEFKLISIQIHLMHTMHHQLGWSSNFLEKYFGTQLESLFFVSIKQMRQTGMYIWLPLDIASQVVPTCFFMLS